LGVPVKEQSFKFALKIVRFYTEHISCNYKYRPLFYQLVQILKKHQLHNHVETSLLKCIYHSKKQMKPDIG